jgi:hypothetical protein
VQLLVLFKCNYKSSQCAITGHEQVNDATSNAEVINHPWDNPQWQADKYLE